MVVLLAILNDIPIMLIAYDNVITPKKPVRWNMPRVLTLASLLSVGGVITSFGLFWYLRTHSGYSDNTVHTMMFLKLLVAGHMTIYLTRNQGWLWNKPYPNIRFFLALEGTQVVGTILRGVWHTDASHRMGKSPDRLGLCPGRTVVPERHQSGHGQDPPEEERRKGTGKKGAGRGFAQRLNVQGSGPCPNPPGNVSSCRG